MTEQSNQTVTSLNTLRMCQKINGQIEKNNNKIKVLMQENTRLQRNLYRIPHDIPAIPKHQLTLRRQRE